MLLRLSCQCHRQLKSGSLCCCTYFGLRHSTGATFQLPRHHMVNAKEPPSCMERTLHPQPPQQQKCWKMTPPHIHQQLQHTTHTNDDDKTNCRTPHSAFAPSNDCIPASPPPPHTHCYHVSAAHQLTNSDSVACNWHACVCRCCLLRLLRRRRRCCCSSRRSIELISIVQRA